MSHRLRHSLPQLIVALVLASALIAGGIGIAKGLPGHRSPKPAAVLRWANEGTSDLLTLDPARGMDLNGRQAAQIIFGGLVRFGPNFQVLPDTASRRTVSADRLTYTFYLRPGVRFADGTPLTAADVAFSLNRILSPAFNQHSGAFLLQA